VNAAALATWLPNVAAAQYSVDGASDCKVIVGTGDRGIQVKTGTIIGDGIYDIFSSVTNLNLASVASGSRWDMIVCRRTWSSTPGASTSVFTIIQGSATKGLPSRNNNKGVQSDQPVALVRVQAGSTSIQEIVDLRCWAHNGGVYAIDELVKGYLDQPGTHLTIGDKAWVRVVTPGVTTNDSSWVEVSGSNQINLYDRGSQMPGNASKSGTAGFLVQAGTSLITTNAQAQGILTFPTPFPNGLLTITMMSADDSLFNDMNIVLPGAGISGTTAGKTSVLFWIYGASGGVRHRSWPNKQIRVNWIAIGY
jgi:hypothetical protein